MLDEPFAGIDPVTVQNIQVIIRQLVDQGIAILITDHAAREILQITDRTYVVSEGRILVSGTADEIVRHDQVRAKYLGDLEFSRSHRIDTAMSKTESKPVKGPVTSTETSNTAAEIAFTPSSRPSEVVMGNQSAEAKSTEATTESVAEVPEVTFATDDKPKRPRLRRTDLE